MEISQNLGHEFRTLLFKLTRVILEAPLVKLNARCGKITKQNYCFVILTFSHPLVAKHAGIQQQGGFEYYLQDNADVALNL